MKLWINKYEYDHAELGPLYGNNMMQITIFAPSKFYVKSLKFEFGEVAQVVRA